MFLSKHLDATVKTKKKNVSDFLCRKMHTFCPQACVYLLEPAHTFFNGKYVNAIEEQQEIL